VKGRGNAQNSVSRFGGIEAPGAACHISTARCISLGGEGNVLYPVLFSALLLLLHFLL